MLHICEYPKYWNLQIVMWVSLLLMYHLKASNTKPNGEVPLNYSISASIVDTHQLRITASWSDFALFHTFNVHILKYTIYTNFFLWISILHQNPKLLFMYQFRHGRLHVTQKCVSLCGIRKSPLFRFAVKSQNFENCLSWTAR